MMPMNSFGSAQTGIRSCRAMIAAAMFDCLDMWIDALFVLRDITNSLQKPSPLHEVSGFDITLSRHTCRGIVCEWKSKMQCFCQQIKRGELCASTTPLRSFFHVEAFPDE